jgi:hypothetical protein
MRCQNEHWAVCGVAKANGIMSELHQMSVELAAKDFLDSI